MLFRALLAHEILCASYDEVNNIQDTFFPGKFGWLKFFLFHFIFVCLFTHKTGIITLAEKNPKCR